MENIINPYVSIEILPEAIEEISDALSKRLIELGIEFEISERPHLSIAYIVGEKSLKEMNEIISNIAEDSFKVRPVGIDILHGKMFNCDYLSLAILMNDDFLYAQEYIGENCEVVSNFDGKSFIAHISLFKLDYKYRDIHFDLARVLELFTSDILTGIKIHGVTISVFNQNRELLIKKEIAS